MRSPKTFEEYYLEVFTAATAFIKCSKLYILFIGFTSWFFSTYPIKDIIIVFVLMTFLDTITKINAIAKNKGLKFNPFKKIFWFQIESQGLSAMGRKIFLDYSIPVLVAFLIDTYIFKNAFHFDLLRLKLSIPSAAIVFFTGVEAWSILENLEEAGGKNWFKKGLNWFSGFLPEKWNQVYKKMKKS